MNPELCILVTGAGAPGVAGTLYALRSHKTTVRLRLVLVDANPRAVGRAWSDAFHQVPHGSAPGYMERMLEVCRAEGVQVILPQTTAEVAFLSANRGVFEAAGARVVAGSGAAIDAANNKYTLVRTFERLGLPHPMYQLCRNTSDLRAFASKIGYPGAPFVVKPPVSNGMRGYRKVTPSLMTLEAFLKEKPSGETMPLDELCDVLSSGAQFPEMLATEYLPGPEYTVDAFLGTRGALALPRLRRSIRSGISFDNVIERRRDMEDCTIEAARALGLTGTFGFQFKLDAQGVPKVLECNPRVQGTMVASLFTGVNLIWLAVRYALGEEPDIPSPTADSVEFQRYWGGVAFLPGATQVI